ncbi:uncharacterized protein LOC111049798 isoform X2 [Nilaparvata lugens]|nr:uncharacterized protein LOC111049798 isoform X2 [Nilaparvata lugens]XP_039283781.1 uncharacterized protein LOC111049798 isoform X2 [Nilaparvata lugens]XP_039283782.1 uncharacterized protein LOC111049798 isoform X2 [Nilaparvata lugens]XP_039283783.1 uncharacterized protein LOC111049798 isoform X2 [Nilaparvata lugens]XP_039283785.1 uncharacterized protein LOC111049798 isoform X2 [Nilaparvata lugens]XP_039283786.1 uncharacterized protein LOC111049798 isoform X2 [Nilaparvata lugens]XP_03928378
MLNTSMQYGFEDGMTLLLNLSSHDSVYSMFSRNVATVILHSPKDFPSFNHHRAFITAGTETFYKYSTSAMIAGQSVEYLDPSTRQCYSHDEVKLKFFDHYTLENCFIEADMEAFIAKCDCLPLEHPNPGLYKDCTIYNALCYATVKNANNHNLDKFIHIEGRELQCFETCSYVRHTPIVYSANIDGGQFNSYGIWDNITNSTGLSLLNLCQQSSEAIVYQREIDGESWRTIVWFGGVAGVVFGLNILNGVEFIYFFTIRFYRYLKKRYD